MSSKPDQTAGAWSNYWSKGFLTTFVGGEQSNYSGRIRQYWEHALSKLANNATIADLGAGNGAILALAKEFMAVNDTEFKLHAVDYADISSSEFYTNNADIVVHANTSIEQTQIDTNSIDLCVSQFGFEYSDTEAATAEVLRILKPGGQFKALMHHHQSEVSIAADSALQQVTLCERSELAETTIKLLRRLQKLAKSKRSATDDAKASELRNYFNNMATRLNEYADQLPDAEHISYFLSELGNLFGSKATSMSFDEKIAVVDQLQSDSTEYYERMNSMLEASSNQRETDALVNNFTSLGFKVEPLEEFAHDEQKLAWVICATKIS